MRTLRSLLFLSLFCNALSIALGQRALSVPRREAQNEEFLARANSGALALRPTGFEENRGQVLTTSGLPAPFVRYRLSEGNASIFLLNGGIAYQFDRPRVPEGYMELRGRKWRNAEDENRLQAMQAQARLETYRMDMMLEGANPGAGITTEGRSNDHTNYYNRGVLDVHTFSKVVYHEVYPGIDWSISTTAAGFEYDFIVRPGADPSRIKLRFKDHEELFIGEAGNLIHGNRLGRFTEERPVSFQDGRSIPTTFRLEGDLLSFNVSSYDRSRTLTIDPPRLWGTYYGGTGFDYSQGVALDASGNIYLAGWSQSTSAIATPGTQQQTWMGEDDAMLVKFNPSGARLWGTYYGGTLGDAFASCAVSGGYVYGAGITRSTNIGFEGHQGGLGGDWDGLLVQFNTSDGTRNWATYYGGTLEDRARGCAVDPSGNVYMAGFAMSTGQGVIASNMEVHQWAFGGGSTGQSYSRGDAFLVKFDSNGNRLWGTYYGGTSDDEGSGCATDGLGNVYLGGGTGSSNGTSIATAGSHQPSFAMGGSDAFLAKFDGNGNRLWATYYGGASSDYGFACAVDPSNNAYLTGDTYSDESIASGGHQNIFGGGPLRDAFLVKFNSSGARQWATYYGGTNEDTGRGCTTDGDGNVYLIGETVSTNAISFQGHQMSYGGGEVDGYLAQFAPSGTRVFGTYYGGLLRDEAYTAAVDGSRNIYLCGRTLSSDAIGTANGHQPAYGGVSDAYLVKFGDPVDCQGVPNGPAMPGTACDDESNCTTNDTWSADCQCLGTAVPGPTMGTVTGNSPLCVGDVLNLQAAATGIGTITYLWSGPDGFGSGQQNPSISNVTVAAGGTYNVTASNGCGNNATGSVAIIVNPQPTTATAGGAQTICVNGTTSGLGGNAPTTGTGAWSVIGGGTGTFNPNNNTPNATFTHTGGPGPVILRWTISNAPCTASTANVSITIAQPPTASTTGGNQTICWLGTTVPLGGNTPAIGVGQWVIMAGPGTGTFSDPFDPDATFTHTGGEATINLVWMITNEPCNASMGGVDITLNQPPSTATVGGPQTICASGTTTGLGGNTPQVGTGAWSVVSGGTGSFSNAGSPNATFTHTGGAGPVILRWTISNAPCAPSTADVTITINQPPTTATVGGPQTICANGTTTGLGGNTPTAGTGAWSLVGGGTGNFSNATSANATFTHTGGVGPVTVRWTISNAPCTPSTAEVTITINQPPTAATVGGPQTICTNGTTTGLGGNTPTIGTGAWSVVSGGTGTFSNATSPNATFTHTGGAGPVIVRWTISNAPCTASTANVTITINAGPSTATTGGAQTICANGTTAGLGGNTPAVGTGAWSVVSGGTGTFSNATSPNATFTHTGGTGPIIVRWTISNAPCAPSTADATITINQPPTAATAGGPQTICTNGTTAGLGGNTPTVGTGAWSVVSGGTGTFSNATSPSSTFTHTGGAGPVIVRWTISNAPCTASTANVTITINQAPTAATVGNAQTICANGTTSGLGGNTPGSGTGAWSVVSGGTGIFNPNAGTPNATFTHATGTGPLVLRWTITNAPCAPSTADVTITITQPPSTASVGGAQTICTGGTTLGLSGNTPANGTGAWSVVSGGTGTFSPNAAAPNSTFTHATGTGPIILRWTISNAPCAASMADVTITINPSPTTATVGGPQTICANGTTTGLGGNTPTNGTGAWSVVSGGTGTFSNAASPNATFTHTGGAGPIIVRWTISNAPCTASTANVTITISQPPTTATTGSGQTICANGTSAGLGGNTPANGTGAWSVVSGGTGTFSNSGSPNATFTHTGGAGPIILRWTISNAPCTSTSAEVTITINQPPTTATAGGPQAICTNGTTTGLGGNAPTVGAGSWSIVSGGTGTFSNAATPNATFTHTGGAGPIIVRWTISNAPCAASTANVTITINQPPTAATVGGAQTICANGTTSGLGGNTPTTGTGAWSVVSGGTGTFSNAGSPNATFTHTGGVGPIVLRWTISNAPCTASTANVTITINQAPTAATTGGPQTICANGTTAGLGGNTPTVGTGVWSVVSGGTGTFSNAGTPNATFTHTGGAGPIIVRWTISNAPCTASTANVTITINQPPTTATTGTAQTICANGTTTGLGGNTPTVGTGAWSVVSGGTGTFSNAGTPNATFTHTGGAGPIVLRWTITNAPCAASFANVTVTISPDSDGDGLCDVADNCPNVSGQVGSPCNDGNDLTINDALNALCNCIGTPVSCVVNGDCDDEDPCTSDACVNNVCVFTPITTDTDGDGIPNCADDCPTVDGEIGSPCNDNDPCTINDVLNGACACIGTASGDTDGDGICNAQDDCPNVTGEIGSACSDNDPCTINDVLNANCLCTGTFSGDTDLDGICNAEDSCPNVPGEVGSPCDDGNACTINDVLNPNCQCAGTLDNTDTDGDGIPNCSDDCPNVDGEIGSPCDDGNACTVNDELNIACQCTGTPDGTDSDDDGVPDCADNCPNVVGQVGTACDDDNVCTLNDVLNSGCQCAGTPDNTDTDGDGTPDCADDCPSVAGQIGTACNDNNACTVNDVLNANCVCTGTVDNTDTDTDGIPDCSDDCPNVIGQQGDPCDDGNDLTINDELNAVCICVGLPVSCVVNGDCNDQDPCTNDACVSNECVFTPITTDDDGDGIPNCEDDCPAVPGEQGSACDDGNVCTVGDILNPACQCAGSPDNTDTDADGVPDCEDDCPTVVGEVGSPCDDGNDLTINDELNASCVCQGIPVSCAVPGDCNDNDPCTSDDCVDNACVYTPLTADDDGDGFPNCEDPCPAVPGVPGSSCDDGNDCTTGDVLTPNCNCAGTPSTIDTDGDGIPDCDDECPTQPGEPGSTCNDNDPCTVSDVLDGDCICAGSPAQVGPISGDDSIGGWTTNTYSVPPIPGLNSFVWFLPENWSSNNTTSSSLTAFTQNGPDIVDLCVTGFLPDCPLDTACLEVVVSNSIGMEDPAPDSNIWFMVRPNPSRGIFELVRTGNGHTPVSLVVFDATGRQVLSPSLPTGRKTTVLDMGDASPGVYFLHVLAGNETQVVRLVIQR